jgi:hypothetical protein
MLLLQPCVDYDQLCAPHPADRLFKTSVLLF